MSSLFPDPISPGPARKSRTTQHAWVNAHCDGGARGNPGPSGYGALIQDDEGIVLAELSEFLGHRTNNYAEYSGLLGCLQWALDHDHPRLRVVSDSELMVKQIQCKYKVNSPDLKPLWEEARRRIGKLEAFEISHALRHKNKHADRLANEAMDRGSKPQARAESARYAVESKPVSTTRTSESQEAAPKPSSSRLAEPLPEQPRTAPAAEGKMLRGFTRGGSVHLLGGASLPDGVFVKVIVE